LEIKYEFFWKKNEYLYIIENVLAPIGSKFKGENKRKAD
jgi:hypothetical protein